LSFFRLHIGINQREYSNSRGHSIFISTAEAAAAAAAGVLEGGRQ